MQAEAMKIAPFPAVAPARRLPIWRQFALLLRLQFSDYRESAAFLALFSVVMPLGLFWMMGNHLDTKGPEASWFLAGNAVMAVAFGSTNFAVGRVGLLRITKQIDFYATLPVHKAAFVSTLFLLNQISALPGLVASLLVGHYLLEIPFRTVAIAFPIALLASASLTVVGAAVGSFVRNNGQLNLYSNLVYFVVMFLSPVLIPTEKLPFFLRWTAYLLPPGQAAMAIRDALAGQFGLHFWGLTGALVLWIFVAGFVGLRKLDWRSD